MDSYYDGLIRQVKELMDDSRHAEAFDLLKEENFTQWVYDKNYHKSDWFYKS